MPSILEKIDDALEDYPHIARELRVLLNKAKIEIEYQREEFKKAEAEIVRLREGLRDLRHGIFKDADAVNTLIDKLLKAEETKEF